MIMKLSIITINYNNEEGLRRTLASVGTQTYRDIEHIIVDGGSTDESVDVIREYAQNEASFASDIATNTSRKATGKYVQILNSGDILAAEDVTEQMVLKLSELTNEQVNDDSIAILYGNMVIWQHGQKGLHDRQNHRKEWGSGVFATQLLFRDNE